jgi:ferrous iron transport protein A
MPDKGLMDLTRLEDGKTGCVAEIRGGASASQKLHAIGIVPGRALEKISKAFMKGPVVVIVGTTRIAIGHGLAKKIFITPIPSSRP